jgi:hypothetical protein
MKDILGREWVREIPGRMQRFGLPAVYVEAFDSDEVAIGKVNATIQAAIAQDFTARLEALYDAKAQEKQYDTRYTCALRAGYPGPFQAEGIAFAQWMDACNAYAYAALAAVLAGQRQIPTWDTLRAELPAAPW